jgi:hypothetical protein
MVSFPRYRQWDKKLDVALIQKHCAGEKLFVGYVGQGFPPIDLSIGEILKAYLFIATLGPVIIPLQRPF